MGVLCCCYLLSLISVSFAMTSFVAQRRLRAQLFGDTEAIDRMGIPTINDSSPLEAHFKFEVSQIVSVDEHQQFVKVNGLVKMHWEDYHYQWNPDDYSGTDLITLPNKYIWMPDLTPYNNAEFARTDHYGQDSFLWLTYTGQVYWVPPVTFHFTCTMDHQFYPFDEQVCNVTIGSWHHDSRKLQLKLDVDHKNMTRVSTSDDFRENAEWDLIQIIASQSDITFDCCQEVRFPVISYSLHIRRRSPTYTLLILTPIAVALFLTLLIFWLPPTGEKIRLGTMNLLVLSLVLLYLGHTIPSGGKNIPQIVVLSSISLVLCGLSVMVSVFVLRLCHNKYNSPMSSGFKSTISGPIRKLLCLGPVRQQLNIGMKLLENGNGDIGEDAIGIDRRQSSRDWLLIATAIDRVAFIVYCILFFILVFSCISV